MHIQHVPAAIDRSEADRLRDAAETTLAEIKADYFADLPDATFRHDHLGNTSLVMKMAAWRFATGETMARLAAAAAPAARAIHGIADPVLHPVFYLRIGYPGLAYSPGYDAAFLDSQPHYDRSFGIHAASFWLALVDIDDATGGLAAFPGEAAARLFPHGDRNKYNYDLYLAAAAGLDPVLRLACQAPPARAGDLLTFDSTVLHGATKPRARMRVSFDFRLASRVAVAAAPAEVRALFAAVDESIDLCNARNLAFVGDHRGAARIFDRLGLRPDHPLDGNPRIHAPHAQMRWQDEYAWLRAPASAA